MVDLSANDLVYETVRSQSSGVAPKKVVDIRLKVNENGNDRKYPALGIPLDKVSLGCPNAVEALAVIDSSNSDNAGAGGANGFNYKVDLLNLTIRVLWGPNDGGGPAPDVELATHANFGDPVFLKLRVHGW